MNYWDRPIHYNVRVKLVVPMLLKGISLGLALMLLKGIYH